MNVKIAVSLPEHLVEDAREAVVTGEAKSVSAYVAAALEAHRERYTLEELLEQWDAELGPPSEAAYAWADEQLKRMGMNQ
jgi:Arc/MetJ-type ribon-helix-helix transcriptional regulator